MLALALAVMLAAPVPKTKAIVLDLRPTGEVEPQTVTLLSGLLTTELGNDPSLDVTSGAEVRRLLELEGEKQALGCDSATCVGEIAGALGARIVVFGDIGKLGARYVVNLSLYDAAAQRAVGRASLQGATGDALADALPSAVQRLRSGPVSAAVVVAPDASSALTNGAAITCIAGTALSVIAYGADVIVPPLTGAPDRIKVPLLIPVAGPFILWGESLTSTAPLSPADQTVQTAELAGGVVATLAATAAIGGGIVWAMNP